MEEEKAISNRNVVEWSTNGYTHTKKDGGGTLHY